jgi:hypothetical protein
VLVELKAETKQDLIIQIYAIRAKITIDKLGILKIYWPLHRWFKINRQFIC